MTRKWQMLKKLRDRSQNRPLRRLSRLKLPESKRKRGRLRNGDRPTNRLPWTETKH